MAEDKKEKSEAFAKSSGKTYSLVELVRAPQTMVEKGPDGTVFAFPIVAILEALLALGVGVLLLIFSLLKDAPLEEIANPLVTTDPAKAPWYFMALQEMLEHMHPFWAGVALPGVVILFLIAIPYIDHSRKNAGIWFTSQRGKRITLWTSLYTLVVIPAFVVLDNTFPPRELLRDAVPQFVSQSLIPMIVLGILLLIPVIFVLRTGRGKATTREVMIAIFTFLFVAAVVLTLVGFLFRGPGFELHFPWDMPGEYNPLDHL